MHNFCCLFKCACSFSTTTYSTPHRFANYCTLWDIPSADLTFCQNNKQFAATQLASLELHEFARFGRVGSGFWRS